ncbi:MAG: protein kinase [Polyangiaceae bacterium]|nr:protein kinase [Polyangiaceae bacterium]
MPIASGGMAMVWAARLKGTRGFEKIVAIKTMLPKLSEDEQFERMFLDEARLASQIRHPHVVEILDLGEQDGVLFLVMEWIEGVPLNQLMKAARAKGSGVPIQVAVRIAMQACAGLHSAHELKDKDGTLVGLVHRDVSPQNILVTYDGVTKVVDFGVAKATALGTGATVAGQIKGKVAYMAPEQIKGGSLDRRVDLFALGIVLYALTTGKHPFRRESEAATMYNICSPQPVVPPRKVKPDYPPQLERILIQALAKDPERRYATANEMLRALDQLPASLRASTDDEVGQVVRELLGERRQSKRQALDDAIERANNAPQVGNDWGPEARTGSSVSSMVSRSGLANSGGGSGATGPFAGTGVTGTLVGQLSVRHRMVMAAGVAAAILLALAVIISLKWGGAEPAVVPAASVATTVVQPPVRPQGSARPAPTVSASASATPGATQQVGDAGSSKTNEAPETPPEKTGRPTGATAVTQPPPTYYRPRESAPKPDTGAKPKPNWKHDPGF